MQFPGWNVPVPQPPPQRFRTRQWKFGGTKQCKSTAFFITIKCRVSRNADSQYRIKNKFLTKTHEPIPIGSVRENRSRSSRETRTWRGGEETTNTALRFYIEMHRVSVQRQTADRHDSKTNENHQAPAGDDHHTVSGSSTPISTSVSTVLLLE